MCIYACVTMHVSASGLECNGLVNALYMVDGQEQLANLLHRECIRNLPDGLRASLIAIPNPSEKLVEAVADALDPGVSPQALDWITSPGPTIGSPALDPPSDHQPWTHHRALRA